MGGYITRTKRLYIQSYSRNILITETYQTHHFKLVPTKYILCKSVGVHESFCHRFLGRPHPFMTTHARRAADRFNNYEKHLGSADPDNFFRQPAAAAMAWMIKYKYIDDENNELMKTKYTCASPVNNPRGRRLTSLRMNK